MVGMNPYVYQSFCKHVESSALVRMEIRLFSEAREFVGHTENFVSVLRFVA